jgi:hypothetical protein
MKFIALTSVLIALILYVDSAPANAVGCPGVRTTMAEAAAALSAADNERARSLDQHAIEQIELCSKGVLPGSLLYVTYQALEAVAATSAAARWANDDRQRRVT